MWDQFEVKGDMTLRNFLEHFRTEHKLIVTMIGSDVTTLYSRWVKSDKLKERENMT